MLIKYKGKLFKEVVPVTRKSVADAEAKKAPLFKRVNKRSFIDAELSGNEVGEYIAEIKGKVPSYVRAIESNINESLDRLSRKGELDYSDVEQAVIKAVEHFLETPASSIVDF